MLTGSIKSSPWGLRGWWESALFPYFLAKFWEEASSSPTWFYVHHFPAPAEATKRDYPDLTPGCSQKGVFLVLPQLWESKPNPQGAPWSRHNLIQRHSEAWLNHSLAKADETQNRKVNSHHHLSWGLIWNILCGLDFSDFHLLLSNKFYTKIGVLCCFRKLPTGGNMETVTADVSGSWSLLAAAQNVQAAGTGQETSAPSAEGPLPPWNTATLGGHHPKSRDLMIYVSARYYSGKKQGEEWIWP